MSSAGGMGLLLLDSALKRRPRPRPLSLLHFGLKALDLTFASLRVLARPRFKFLRLISSSLAKAVLKSVKGDLVIRSSSVSLRIWMRGEAGEEQNVNCETHEKKRAKKEKKHTNAKLLIANTLINSFSSIELAQVGGGTRLLTPPKE